MATATERASCVPGHVPELCQWCRYAPALQTRKIREAIETKVKPNGPYDLVRMDCFSKDEADAIRAGLTPDERKLVVFTWVRS
jgi:hypothetical protein